MKQLKLNRIEWQKKRDRKLTRTFALCNVHSRLRGTYIVKEFFQMNIFPSWVRVHFDASTSDRSIFQMCRFSLFCFCSNFVLCLISLFVFTVFAACSNPSEYDKLKAFTVDSSWRIYSGRSRRCKQFISLQLGNVVRSALHRQTLTGRGWIDRWLNGIYLHVSDCICFNNAINYRKQNGAHITRANSY